MRVQEALLAPIFRGCPERGRWFEILRPIRWIPSDSPDSPETVQEVHLLASRPRAPGVRMTWVPQKLRFASFHQSRQIHQKRCRKHSWPHCSRFCEDIPSEGAGLGFCAGLDQIQSGSLDSPETVQEALLAPPPRSRFCEDVPSEGAGSGFCVGFSQI